MTQDKPDFSDLPTPAQILDALKRNPKLAAKRLDLARHFKLKGAQRRWFRALLREMEESGQLAMGPRRTVQLPEALPTELVVEITGLTPDGEPLAKPVDGQYRNTKATIVIVDNADVEPGDQAEVTLRLEEPGIYSARVRRKLATGAERTVLGTFSPQGRNRPGHLLPLDPHRIPRVFLIAPEKAAELKDGALVVGRPRPQANPQAPVWVDITEVLGQFDQGIESLVAIYSHDIPFEFPDEVVAEAEHLPAGLTHAEVAEREDLRQLPIVTIDGPDAKDFDDAVWAEPWENNGHHVIVAIADVAHYIREGGALDKEAFKRGNSVYFPDRVVPMLPERLSNDLCSLRPHEDRPVLAVHMYIDKQGQLQKYKFSRAVIHSHARLTYERVFDALEGRFDDETQALFEPTIKPLHAVYKVLLDARKKRNALDLDMPEKKVIVGPGGEVVSLTRRERNDAHRLIEELMITANVAAADALERREAPCLYRVHPEPTPEKLQNLQESLKLYNVKLERLKGVRPEHMQNLIERISGRDEQDLLMQLVLRSQQQAVYTPENKGHFGLALERYAHFTSPIRRYSDLVVHRSLVKNLKLAGKGGLLSDDKRLHSVAEHLSVTERRAQHAEWDAVDRLTTRFYSAKVGSHFPAQVISVQRFGLFVMIEQGLAEGLLPMGLLGPERFHFDQQTNMLVGSHTRRRFKIGDKFDVTLVEANLQTGQLTFAMGKLTLEQADAMRAERAQFRERGARGRGRPQQRPDQRNTSQRKHAGHKRKDHEKRPSRHSKKQGWQKQSRDDA